MALNDFWRRLLRGNGGTSPDDSHRKLEALCDPDTLRQVEDRHVAIDRALKTIDMTKLRTLLVGVAFVGLSACSMSPPIATPVVDLDSIVVDQDEINSAVAAEARAAALNEPFRLVNRPKTARCQLQGDGHYVCLFLLNTTCVATSPNPRSCAPDINGTWVPVWATGVRFPRPDCPDPNDPRCETEPPPPPPPEARTGLVRSLGGGVISDDQGVFVALGTTFFPAVHWFKTDPARLDSELAFLQTESDSAFDYVRILGALGGDCDSYWREIRVDPTDPQFRQSLGATIDRIYDRHGMRVALTIFGGDCWSHSRRATIDDVLAVISTRADKVILVEIANEGWQNEYSGEFQALRNDAEYLAARTPHLVAPTASFSGECELEGGHEELYDSLRVSLFTAHYDRERNLVDGPWRPVRQPWGTLFCGGLPSVAINGEPIGPGSSGDTDFDPLRLVSAAIVSFISDHSFYTLHTTAGVRNDTRFAQIPNIRTTLSGLSAMKSYVPADIVAWSEQNSHWDGHPFEPFQHWVDEGPPGVVRGYGVTNGCDFKVLPMGIQQGVMMQAKRDMNFDLINPLTGSVLGTHSLDGGDSIFVGDQQAAVWVSGRCR